VGGLAGGAVSGLPFFHLTNSDSGFVLAYLLSGLSIGLGIGIAHESYKTAWFSVTGGSQAGQNFIIFKDVTSMGGCPLCDIYLPQEDGMLLHHAELIKMQHSYKIKAIDQKQKLFVNSAKVREGVLKNGDRVKIGSCEMVFNIKRDI
jgi:pSer/pThr/pTyr-binding forkhead associated (FHA) protein